MARLTRKNIKVFAGDATNNGVFGSLQANNPTLSNDVEQIQSLTAWSEGWDYATETSEALPPLEEFQGVQYVTTYQQAYIMQEGMPEWAATVTYYKGSLTKKVTATGFQIYNSLTDNNTGNLLSDTDNWKLVMDSDNLYALDNNVVHKTGDETISGLKIFKGLGDEKIHIQNTNVTYNTAPLSSVNNTIAFVDKNDYGYGIVQCWRYTDNSTFTLISARGANNTWPSTALGIGMKADGTTYTLCPPPTDTTQTNSNQIDTVGARNTRINDVLAALYPVGSIYIGTQSTCPLASLISGSTWTKIPGDKVLQSSSSNHAANTTIAAGLPNITGSIDKIDVDMTCGGAFYQSNPGSGWNVEGTSGSDRRKANFDASRVSSIYGNSSTVQPPAYVVNVWRRTA